MEPNVTTHSGSRAASERPRASRHQARALPGTGTSNREYVVLRVLPARGPVENPSSLHEFLAAEPQLNLGADSAGELLARLQARGLAAGTAATQAPPS